MNRQAVLDWAAEQYGTTPDYPWQDDNVVLRHAGNRKWYGLLMNVRQKQLGLSGDDTVDILNVKCDPRMIGALRMQPGFLPAYHMNRDHWISILLDGSVSEEEIKNLLDISYALTGIRKKH